jgi:Fe-S oxidoreductase
MAETTGFAPEREHAARLSCGRTFDEQIESIRKHGSHGMIQVARAGVLAAMGIPGPKDKAENGIIFGCYRPFTTPFLLRDYIRLLDLLGVDYTYFDREFCCGLPLIMQSAGGEQEKAIAAGSEFNRLNLGLAHQKGATTLAYCCVGCVYAAKNCFRDAPGHHVYIVDLILDKLEKETLGVAPTVMGYFEGCHTFYSTHFPRVSMEWKRYRQFLDGIKGLKIVDLSNNLCCKRSAAKIADNAIKLNLDKVLCSCNGCYLSLKEAGKGKFNVLSLPEVLLQGLGKL